MGRFLLLLIFLLPIFSHAQFSVGEFTGPQNSLVVQPSYPGPGQDYTVTLDDYSGGAYGASINWFIDGTERVDLKNNRSITLQASELNTETTIRAVLTTPDTANRTLTTTITPRYLDIIFEPQTHVPSFYKGRALPSQGSIVNTIALLHGTNIPTANLIYTWQVNNEVINGGPLRGQNRISFTTPLGDEVLVSVQVTTTSGEVLARRVVALPSVRPELHFYEVNTLYGVNQKSLSTLLLLGNSVTVRAVPYYLDSRVFNQPDIATWEIDRSVYDQGINPYEVTLQRAQNNGSSRLNFQVQSTTAFLQGVEGSLPINY